MSDHPDIWRLSAEQCPGTRGRLYELAARDVKPGVKLWVRGCLPVWGPRASVPGVPDGTELEVLLMDRRGRTRTEDHKVVVTVRVGVGSFDVWLSDILANCRLAVPHDERPTAWDRLMRPLTV